MTLYAFQAEESERKISACNKKVYTVEEKNINVCEISACCD